jgi:hypothetical protein
MWRVLVFAAALAGVCSFAGEPVRAEEAMRLSKAGFLEMAGRQVHCERVRLRLDRHLENLGAAAPDDRLLVINPFLLRQYSRTVQLFVFHHECGHHRVGASELKADCWAVERGVRDGWLDRNGLSQVCRSFEDAPETETHPSGRRRCANIDRCFAATERAIANEQKAQQRQIETAALRAAPKLVSGPHLVRSSVLR